MPLRSLLYALVGTAVLVVAACSSAASRTDSTMSSEDVDAAIAAGSAYLESNAAELPALLVPVVDYLHRMNPEAVAAPRVQRLRAAAEDPASDAAIFVRLVDADVRMTAERLNAEDDEINVITAPALFCDRIRPPDSYAATLDTATVTGDYELTHAALADQWMVELGCDAERGPERRAEQVDRLVALVRAAGPATDLGMEAIAILTYTGNADRVEDAWITAVVDAQRSDGAWGKEPGGPASDHATAMALWALLGSSRPDAAHLHWIVGE